MGQVRALTVETIKTMKKIGFGQVLGVLANLGVLAGILLVVYELNQNREMMRSQTRHDISSEFVGLMISVANNDQLANLIRRGDLGEELSPDELYRYERYTRGMFRYWENVHYQYRLGLYDELEFVRQRAAWQAYLARSKGGVAWWCGARDQFSADYRLEMDELLTTITC
jgi:hypothetical protein